MTKRRWMAARSVAGGLALAGAALLAGCGASNLERRYGGLLAELERVAPDRGGRERGGIATSGVGADDGRGLFADSAHLDRAAVVEAVLARNPDVEAARQAWRAALTRFPRAMALEDPMVSYSIAPLSVSSVDADFGQRVELEQKLPFPGKRRLAGEVALAESDAARENFDAVRLELALMASNLHDDLYVAARAIEVNHHHEELLEELKKSAEAQYVAGRASQQDPLHAEVELARLEQERIVLEAERAVLVAQLNGLLHRPPDAPLPSPGAELDDLREVAGSRTDLEREALASRPELRASAAELRGAHAATDAAALEYYPDLELMGSYDSMWNTPEHQWMIGIGLNIPLQVGRRRAAVDEARAGWGRARSEQQKLGDQIRVEVAQTDVRAREAAQVVSVVERRLLPAARDQVDAALAGFRSGRNPFMAVIEAEKNLREVELDRHRARAELSRRLAARDRALGRVPGLSRGDAR